MGVDWNLGGPGPDIGQQMQAGFEHGRQVRQQQDRTNALRGYAANPNDRGAQNALLAADPALSMQLEDQRFQREHAQHQAALEAVAQHRDRINIAGEMLAQHPVTDQASYTQLLGAIHQAGYDISDVPTTYDPNYVAQVQQLHATFERQQPGYTLDQGATRFRGDGSMEAQGAPKPPRYYAVPPGGRLVADPSYPGAPQEQGSPPPANLPHANSPADIAHLPPGSQFIAPDGLVHTVPGGGAGQPQAQGTFPRQDGGAFDFRIHPAGS